MRIIFLILFILISPITSFEIDDLYSTRFEKFWTKNFNKMNFRDPIQFIPYTIKIGYSSYGGKDYWKKWDDILIGEDTYVESPYNLNNENFPDISNLKYRKSITIELDILKYNFFKKYQNFVDILFGVGYRYNQTSNKAYFQDIVLQPKFQGWNFNSTILKQWSPKFLTFLYYSYGTAKAKFYETSNGSATGRGMMQNIGFGFNIISPSKVKKNNLIYGLEIRFEQCKIDDIAEPQNFNKIKDFHSRSVGIIYSFGIGYGGEESIGDKAYLDLMNGNYISSLEKMQEFQFENPYKSKQNDISIMMEVAREKIPQQLYNQAMGNYYKGDLDKALKILHQADYKSNDSLNFKIDSKKYIIANEIFDNSNKLMDGLSSDEQVDFLNNIKKISSSIDIKVNKKISSILIKQGDEFIDEKNFKLAYEKYLLSLDYHPSNQYIVDIKIDNLTTFILNDVYKFLQINEYVIAYEHLSFIKNISRYNENTKALMDIVTKKLEDDKLFYIRDRVKNILDTESNFVIKGNPKDIYLGDHYDEVLNILGAPIESIKKHSLNINYEMLIFIVGQIEYKLFFKNKILIDVEREL